MSEQDLLPAMARRHRSRWFIVFLFFVTAGAVLYVLSTPNLTRLKRENPGKTAFMKYREEEWNKKGGRYRIQQKWVPLPKISPYLVNAVLIAEDDKFWTHRGFDYEAIQKALEKDLRAKRLKWGGSTITQQLARNLYLSPQKGLIRKALEAWITWRMEQVLGKKRILELYLNVVELGEGIFGAEAAALHYFGKSSMDLSPEEATRLASILPNPRKYKPTGNHPHVTNRANQIYEIMVKRGIVVPRHEEVLEEKHSAKGGEASAP